MRQQTHQRQAENIWKGLAAGLVGGLVASWTMKEFQDLVNKLSEGGEQAKPKQSTQSGKSGKDGGQVAQKKKAQDDAEGQDDATVKAASAIAEGVFDHKLTKSEKKVAGPAVHYVFGTTMGGLYGAAAEFVPVSSAGVGLPFGTVFYLGSDEVAVPALGLSKSPTEYPLSTHAYALASHLVYGLTTEIVRRAIRSTL